MYCLYLLIPLAVYETPILLGDGVDDEDAVLWELT